MDKFYDGESSIGVRVRDWELLEYNWINLLCLEGVLSEGDITIPKMMELIPKKVRDLQRIYHPDNNLGIPSPQGMLFSTAKDLFCDSENKMQNMLDVCMQFILCHNY
jgi:hypothetical protein